jgi:hypothetical protein
MSGAGKFVVYGFFLVLAVILLRNAAGTVGIMLAGGTESDNLVHALEGAGQKPANKGSFKTGKTSISLGG